MRPADGGPVSLAAAWAWLDAVPWEATEAVDGRHARGRLLAAPVTTPVDVPDHDRAAWNGFGVRAAEVAGASAYNPVNPARRLTPLASGDRMARQDAVLPFDAVDETGAVIAEIAPGEGVVRRGEQLRAGEVALPAGRVLRAAELALLAALAVGQVTVRRPPQVVVLIAGPIDGPDVLTPLLTAALAQDGVTASPLAAPLRADMAGLMAACHCDLLLVAGRGGEGGGDDTRDALADAGGLLAGRGVAIRPGGSSGFGWLGATPVLLLPGEPLSCLAAYELLAARLVRRMTGRAAPPPTPAMLRRKLVSGVGYADLAPVRLDGDQADRLETGGLAGAVRADGYVLVDAESEGRPAGASVLVHRFGGVA